MQIIFFSFVVGILKIYYFPEFFLFSDPIFFGKKFQKSEKSESYFFLLLFLGPTHIWLG